MNPKQTLEDFETLQPMMLAELLQWVEMESPTTSKASVDRFSSVLATQLEKIGMTIETNQQKVRGNHLVGRWTGGDCKPVLMVAHMDTVWELGVFENLPIRVEGNIARGPGIFDMKGGILIALYALRLLREHNLHNCNITLLLNSDEEVGSESSRALIEQEAIKSQCVFILEPAGPNNALKTKRRGTGGYHVIAHGKAAHAGVEPEKGVNAIQELAHQILEIQSWSQQRKTISANVDLIHGGTRSNVIPAEAHAEIDVRCDTLADTTWLEEKFKSLSARNPLARVEVSGGFDRPPLERTEKVLGLYAEAQEIANAFDYPVSEFWTGGGSDGNLTAALGIPTIDGLGPEGGGAHALDEHILISSLSRRANLLYHLLQKRIRS
jgi:glutamate carboxypeptidase